MGPGTHRRDTSETARALGQFMLGIPHWVKPWPIMTNTIPEPFCVCQKVDSTSLVNMPSDVKRSEHSPSCLATSWCVKSPYFGWTPKSITAFLAGTKGLGRRSSLPNGCWEISRKNPWRYSHEEWGHWPLIPINHSRCERSEKLNLIYNYDH